MLTFPVPDPFDGLLLEKSLADVGIQTQIFIDENGQLILLDTDDHATAAPVVEAHSAKVIEVLTAQQTAEANRQTIEDRVSAALQTNRDFIAIQAPTNAQVVAQVKALTRQNTAIIRLLLNLTEALD